MMATSFSGSLGRAGRYTLDTAGRNAFTAEWLTASQNQQVRITGTALDGVVTDYSSPSVTTNLNLGTNSFTTVGNVNGIGVAAAYSGWFTDPTKIRAEINYDPNTNKSQVLTLKWADNQTVQSAFIDLSQLIPKNAEEEGNEVGFLQAFRDGVEVDITGIRMASETTVSGSQTSLNNSQLGVTFQGDRTDGDYKLKVFGSFDELRFSAKAYTNPTAAYLASSFKDDSSDYLLQQIKYEGITQPIGTLQFSAPVFSVNEDGTPIAAVTVTRTGGTFGAVGATINLTNGSATAPGDYASNPIAVNFADGDSSPKVITIPIVDDRLVEGTETVNLSLVNPTGGATLGTQTTATLNIVDNDSPGTLQFSNPQYVVNEDGTPILAVTVTRTGGSAGTVSAVVNSADGTAIAPGDYNNNPITVTFGDNDTSPKVITIPIVDDLLVEGNETVNLTLANPTGGATIGTQNSATLTIIDNDVPLDKPVVFVGALDPTASEPGRGEGNGTFQFARTGGDLSQDVTIRYSVTGTAIAGTDYDGLTGSVTIGAGQSVSAPVTVTPRFDGRNEPTESIVVKIAEDSAYQVGSADTATVRLLDSDPLTGTPIISGTVLRYNSSGAFVAGYANITSAVGAATANDIIVAQAGIYNEPSTITIDKPLTLRGPNAGVSTGNGSTTSPAIVQTATGLPVVTIAPGVNNVTIEGMTINLQNENGIRLQGTSDNLVIRQNTFTGTGPDNGGVIYLDTSGASSAGSLQAIDNLIRDVNTAGTTSTSGIQAFRFDTVRITDNTIANLTGPGVAADSITNSASIITNNRISNTGEQGLQLAGGSATIENNDITNSNTIGEIDRGAIRLRDSGLTGITLGTVNVTSNVLTNSFNGIAVRDGTNITGNVRAQFNNFIGNTNAALYHGGTGNIDASNNWWDDETGPVVGGTGRNAIAGSGASFVSSNPFATSPF
jgi:Calx-beta domain/Right handed beta helix region